MRGLPGLAFLHWNFDYSEKDHWNQFLRKKCWLGFETLWFSGMSKNVVWLPSFLKVEQDRKSLLFLFVRFPDTERSEYITIVLACVIELMSSLLCFLILGTFGKKWDCLWGCHLWRNVSKECNGKFLTIKMLFIVFSKMVFCTNLVLCNFIKVILDTIYRAYIDHQLDGWYRVIFDFLREIFWCC